MIKRLMTLFLIILSLMLLVVPSSQTFAANVFQGCSQVPNAQNTTVCKDNATQSAKSTNLFISIIKDVINLLSFVVGAAAVIMIIIAAIKIVTAGGDSKGVAEARSSLIAAAAGILIIAIGQVIVVFVLNKV